MIFFFVFGHRVRSEDLGPVAPARCPTCRRRVVFHHLATHVESHVFFVPVRSHEASHALVCPACGDVLHLPAESATMTQTMSADHARWCAGMQSDDDHAAAAEGFWGALAGTDGYRGPGPTDAAIALGRGPDDAEVEGWFPDPTGRHDLRFFGGTWWTAFVLDGGTTSNDTFLTPTTPGWYPDPYLRHELRHWNGRSWTDQVQQAGALAVDPP